MIKRMSTKKVRAALVASRTIIENWRRVTIYSHSIPEKLRRKGSIQEGCYWYNPDQIDDRDVRAELRQHNRALELIKIALAETK